MLRRLGHRRLTELVIRVSHGHWREDKASELLAAASESLALWAGGGLDFAGMAADLAAEIRVIHALDTEITRLDTRISELYHQADPAGIVLSVPGLGTTLAAGILARFGDLDRFANLAGVRSYTGIVPKTSQSGNSNGHGGLTKAGDPGLRRALYLAAEHARRADPQLAAKYYRLVTQDCRHHESAVCSIAAVIATRIAGCWRRRETYILRDIDGQPISAPEGRAIIAERYTVPAETRQARRQTTRAKTLKQRTGQRTKKPTAAAPATHPPQQRRLDLDNS